MGGIGSGRHWQNTRVLTTDCKRLDVGSLYRSGALEPGISGTVGWHTGDEEADYVFFNAQQDALRIAYHFKEDCEDDQPEDSIVSLVWSPCRFGGKRPYFLCPNPTCGKMVDHLYSDNGPFLCRHCLNLAYPCQNEDAANRASRRANKIRIKLGGQEGLLTPFPAKPKGMHWRTYLRLWRKSHGAEHKAFAQVIKKLGHELPEHLRA